MAGVAVLSAGWLGTPDGARRRLEDASSLPAIATAAIELEVGAVYALEDGQSFAGGEGWLEPEVTGGDVRVGHPWRVHMRREAASGKVAIVWPAHDGDRSAGPWHGFTAVELLDAFAVVERLLGVAWQHSAGSTVQALILDTHRLDKGGLRMDRAPDMPAPARDGMLETAFVGWRRELTRDERSSVWVHSFDANAQYLAAWQVAELGTGNPIHHARPRFDASRAGLWRISQLPRVPDSLLPTPWLEREWFTTPTVVRMLEVCEGFDAPLVDEAWVWPGKSRYLRAAAERLRDARRACADRLDAARSTARSAAESAGVLRALRDVVTAEAVLEAVKDLYARQTARFGMLREGESPWYRPDWGNTVRAYARCNLHRRLAQLARAPFAIATDALLFATDDPDPERFAGMIRLPLGDGLGQYKVQGSRRMGDDVATLPVGKLFRSLEAVAA